MYKSETYQHDGYKVRFSADLERVSVTLDDGRYAEAWTEEEALKRAREKPLEDRIRLTP